MTYILHRFLLGFAIGILIWLLRSLLRPRARGLTVLRRDEMTPVDWVPVVLNGQIVHDVQKPES